MTTHRLFKHELPSRGENGIVANRQLAARRVQEKELENVQRRERASAHLWIENVVAATSFSAAREIDKALGPAGPFHHLLQRSLLVPRRAA